MTVRTRIAPSPTGIAHLGTAYTAMRNLAIARQNKGQFIVRIEDTDRARYVEGAVEVIFEAMKWLGLTYDEGPYTQSERLPIYLEHAKQLVEKGEAYYCFCTKERLDEVKQAAITKKELPRYDKHCRNLDPAMAAERAKTEPHVIRLKVPETGVTICQDIVRGPIEFQNSGIDDQVLLKSDGYPTYHLGVVVDDHLMSITHIIRGEEWLSSTPKHVLIYQAFGWELPIFTHLPVIRNKDHSKMSKRKNDVSILSHRDKGYLPEAINNFLALMGWSHPGKKEIFSLEEFLKLFTLERITLTAPVYDIEKLNWLNGQYIRELPDTELTTRLTNFIPADCPKDMVSQILPLIKERLVTLKDFEELTAFFYRDITVDQTILTKKSSPDEVKAQLLATHTSLQSLDDKSWTHENIEYKIRSLSEANGWKPGQYFMMLRIALTGKTATPPLFETMAVLGREKVLLRLEDSSSTGDVAECQVGTPEVGGESSN
ncbi:glutamate--tRNA ligase [Candidatus Collierbacteria bacterium CG10_big_fil_rev_8_21_14_0_10_44_9]|uniref:Glutamate--tRNA ligase n=1 Tax=Candidatus Collierbacteria bacterium CG10_big_fil_rev_8_21_14_0_10_44_9 TaxID=1974535 RepID=A0A2H0VJA3_9BACT|nr:MAG: glutamate--tRNA ligase [Candidatus Collierbacteria bacterium CG10_big_fil_rev_8_21_14_0_10_44_9]